MTTCILLCVVFSIMFGVSLVLYRETKEIEYLAGVLLSVLLLGITAIFGGIGVFR